MLDEAAIDMSTVSFRSPYAANVESRSSELARRSGRGSPNVEDQIHAALELVAGLRILGDEAAESWDAELAQLLGSFAARILRAEASFAAKLATGDNAAIAAADVLASFLGSFGSRSATKDRLHIFTTNYDRLIEFALDESGTWQIDRFIGSVAPRFRASRLDLDLYYSPPGIRGEPRYLEQVVRLTKLHGSVDWRSSGADVQRVLVPFGCASDVYPQLVGSHQSVLIYPNPAKDVETSQFPYAELFRDFSAAIVRPETVLVTYGYGFGDDHVNRVIADMLTVPSTHLLVIAFADPNLRLRRFIERTGRLAQVSLLLGSHFGDIENLVQWYLPKPSIDRVTFREAELLQRRGFLPAAAGEFEQDADST
jgi:hypothetical protein